MRLLITGASGLLGLNFCWKFYRQHSIAGVVNGHVLHHAPFPTHTCDLSQEGAVERLLDELHPDAVIHCAAMANIDDCEKDPEHAWQVNAVLPQTLAALTARRGVRLMHISTDAVFDGLRGNYREEDATNPLNSYARAKQASEDMVMQANPEAVIARVNFFGWSLLGKRSLAEWFYYNLKEGKPVNGFIDVLFCPLYVGDLAEILLEMVERGLTGIYHTVSSDWQSKYDFGMRIARRFGLDESLITPISWKDGGLFSVRSPDLRLNTEKLAQALGHPLPMQADGIDAFFEDFERGLPMQLRALAAAGE